MTLNKGQFVIDSYTGYQGIIEKVYKNFFEYSVNETFITLGDGLTWLHAQDYKYSGEELMNVWVTVNCIDGGSIAISKSRIKWQK